MALARKPKNVDEFINDGGSAPQPIAPVKEEKLVQLRLPATLFEEINAAVAKRRPKPSRHQWILEAIVSKLEEEAE